MQPRPLALAVVAVVLASGGVAEAKPGTFAGSLGVKVPKGADASVRAISRANATVAETREVGRRGRFSLKLKPGAYLVVGTVVPKPGGGRIKQQRIGVSLKSGQVRKRTSLKARRKRKRRRAAAAFVQERGQVTPGRIAVGIHPLKGRVSGDWDYLRRGVADLLIVDVMQFSENCGAGGRGVTVVEVERIADIIRELEFQQSPYVDPSTRVVRNFILQDVEVHGTMTDAPGGDAKVNLEMKNRVTGESLGTLEQLVHEGTAFDDLEQLGKRLAEELCKLSDVYEVTLDVNGTGSFATHTATGTMHSVLSAKRTGHAPAPWRASGPLAWNGLAFTSKVPPCVYVNPIAPAVSWSVTIIDAGDGELQVVWLVSGNDATTVSVDCPGDPDPPPIPGQPGPSLMGIAPTTFTVPYAGGVEALSGGFTDSGDGWTNTGTIRVKAGGVARR